MRPGGSHEVEPDHRVAEYAQTHEGSGGAQAAASAPAQGREACEMNVYFPTASAQLDDRAKQQLDAIATCLKRTHGEDTRDG